MGLALKYPAAVPPLDAIVAAPDCLDRLPYDALSALRAKAAATLATIESAQLLALNRPDRRMIEADDDEMITVEEAAKLIRHERRWIWRNKRKLPFVRQISGKSLLVSKKGLERWLTARRLI